MQVYKSDMPEITLKYKRGNVKKVKFSTPDEAAKLFREFYDEDTFELNESFVVIFLTQCNSTIGWTKHSSGGIVGTVVDVRLILATALKCAATSIIISHNHPSGNVRPSNDDDKITWKIREGCRAVDITLVDHIILGDSDKYYSYSEEGRL